MNFLRFVTSQLLNAKADSDGSVGGQTAGDELDDSLFVARAQRGDLRAFEELVNRHRNKTYAMIQNMVKNEADAWDLSQDVFVKAWKALPKFKSEAKFSTWIYRITHNAVYDFTRKRKLKSEGELDDELLGENAINLSAPTSPTLPEKPDTALKNRELRDRIETAIGKLSEQHREVILLREVQGLDYKEIAEVIDCSLGTVMSRLFYARKHLQEDLRDEYTGK